MPDIPHIAFPPRLAGSRLVTFEQDTPEEVQACVITLLRTPKGWSDEEQLRDMGLNRQAFRRGGPDLTEISNQITTFEPRTEATLAQEHPELLNDALADLNVRLATPGA